MNVIALIHTPKILRTPAQIDDEAELRHGRPRGVLIATVTQPVLSPCYLHFHSSRDYRLTCRKYAFALC